MFLDIFHWVNARDISLPWRYHLTRLETWNSRIASRFQKISALGGYELDLWQLKVDGKFSHWKCHRLLLVIRHRVVVLVAANFTATSARDKKEKNHLQQLPGLRFALPMWMTYILNDERRPRAHIVFFAYLNYISRNTYFVPSSFAFLQAK